MKQVTLMILVATIASLPVTATANDCDDAVDSYNSAADDLMSALRRYASCVSSSEGKDDCSGQFSRVRSAQSDFESAVSEIDSYCED